MPSHRRPQATDAITALRLGDVDYFSSDEAMRLFYAAHRDELIAEMDRHPRRLTGPCWALQHLERDPEVRRRVRAAIAAAEARKARIMRLVEESDDD
jgi:hypothetical protein